MVAGTPALVSTLWQVDDRSTRLLMEKFYQAMQTGLDFAEALKQAQLFVKNLTYQEALNILTPIIEADLNRRDTAPIENRKSPSDPPASELVLAQAKTYLRGIANKGRTASEEMSFGERENEKTFAHPRYWAAFVLFGPYDI